MDHEFFHREWQFAERRGDMRLRIDYDRWRFNRNSCYVGNLQERSRRHGRLERHRRHQRHLLGPPTDLLCRDVGPATTGRKPERDAA